MKKQKMELSLKGTVPKTRKEPLWDLYRDGITFSLLVRFYICRHRFWIRTVLGLREDIGFNHKMEYGSLFHAGLEAFAGATGSLNLRIEEAHAGISSYAGKLLDIHGYESSAAIHDWTELAIRQFTLYAKHHANNDKGRKYIAQEQTFRVPVKLPSGRVVDLRGKYDEIFEQPVKGRKNVLQENKCKGDIDEWGITSGLSEDLQTMLYIFTLSKDNTKLLKESCLDVLYNVILRPLGGKYPMRQLKGRMVKGKRVGEETKEMFHDRAIKDIKDNPTKYFHRWNIRLTQYDVNKFRDESLFPILEQLCDWWDSIKHDPFNPWKTQGWERDRETGGSTFSPVRVPNKLHHKRPLGITDMMAMGHRGDYHEFIASGGMNRTGLKQIDTVFPELDDPSLSNSKGSK